MFDGHGVLREVDGPHPEAGGPRPAESEHAAQIGERFVSRKMKGQVFAVLGRHQWGFPWLNRREVDSAARRSLEHVRGHRVVEDGPQGGVLARNACWRLRLRPAVDQPLKLPRRYRLKGSVAQTRKEMAVEDGPVSVQRGRPLVDARLDPAAGRYGEGFPAEGRLNSRPSSTIGSFGRLIGLCRLLRLEGSAVRAARRVPQPDVVDDVTVPLPPPWPNQGCGWPPNTDSCVIREYWHKAPKLPT